MRRLNITFHPIISIILMVVLALIIVVLPFSWLLGSVLVLIGMTQPVLALAGVVLSVPVQEIWSLPGGLSVTQASMGLLLASFAARWLAYPEYSWKLHWTMLPWLFWLAMLLVSTSNTTFDQAAALRETARWAVAFCVYLFASLLLQRPWQLWLLVICLIVAPTLNASYGLWQTISGEGPPSFRLAADLPYVRAYGTMGQPNSFAGYLNMAWPLALSLTFGLMLEWRRARSGWRLRYLVVALLGSGLASLIILAALAASFSRGAWLGAAAGMLVMAVLAGVWARRVVLLGVVAVILLFSLGGLHLLPDALENRLTSITRSFQFVDPATVQVTPDNFAVIERMAHLQAGWKMALAYPWFGVGPGNYSQAFLDVTAAPWYVSRGHAHNYYIHTAAEVGIFGLVCYLFLIGSVLLQALLLVREADRTMVRALGIGCCGIICAVIVHNMFENLHVLNMGIQLALVWVISQQLRQMIKPHRSPSEGAL